MKSKALEVWISLFTDTTCNIWETEREELKKAAMIIEAAKCEFKSNYIYNKKFVYNS